MNKYLVISVILLFGVFGWKFFQSKTPQESSLQTSTTQTGSQVVVSSETKDSLSGTIRTFIPPNTNWPTRTLKGVTYVFGEGNPKEVALNQDQIQALLEKCGTQSDPNNDEYLCKEMDGYVTPEVEKYVKLALSDPSWGRLLVDCEENLRWSELASPLQEPIAYNSENPSVNYNIVAHTDFLDIEKWVIINQETGRKDLALDRLYYLQNWLSSGFEAYWHQFEWPVHSDGTRLEFQNPSCVDTLGVGILRNLVLARVSFLGAKSQESYRQVIERYTNNEDFLTKFFN